MPQPRLLLQRLCKRMLLQLTWLRHHKPTLRRFRQPLLLKHLLRKPQRLRLTLHLQHRLLTSTLPLPPNLLQALLPQLLLRLLLPQLQLLRLLPLLQRLWQNLR